METILKCVKCKSNNLFIIELWSDSSIEWEQIDGKIDRNNGIMEPGNPYRLECKCKECKHRWKVKKHWQIDHVTV